MPNNILDHNEQSKAPRSCPNCGYEFPFRPFVRRYILSYGMSEWACHSCGEMIKCDFVKLQMLWLLGIFVSAVLIGLLTSYFEMDLFNIFFIIPYFAFMLWTLYHAKFERLK